MPARSPQPIDPPAPPPTLRNLFGLLPGAGIPEWLGGDPELRAKVEAEQAQRDAAIDAVRQRVRAAIPEPIKKVARGAKQYLSEQFTPPPYVEDLRSKLKGLTAQQHDPISRPVADLAIDQLAAAQSPGDMALNALPELKAVGGAGHLLAAVPPRVIAGRRPLGSLVKGLTHVGGEEYALKPSVLDRFRELYEGGRGLDIRPSWESAQSEDMLRAFGDDPQLAHLWSRMFGATSAGTDVRKNTKESVSTLAHALETGRQPFTLADIPGEFKRKKNQTFVRSPTGEKVPVQGTILYGNRLTNAPSKVPNLNLILGHQPMSGDKVEAMAQFMWGDPRTPLDRHVLWGAGATADKFAEEQAALREMMMQAEGLTRLSKGKVYTRYEDALRRGLQGLDPQRDYNPLFADVWEGIRAAKGEKYQGGPVDLLRGQNLLDAGAMADPERLIWTLQQNPGRSWVGTPPPSSRSSIIVP
jgi:hypothetical protein